MIRSWLPRFYAASAIVGYCSVATAAFAASPLTAGDKSFVDCIAKPFIAGLMGKRENTPAAPTQ